MATGDDFTAYEIINTYKTLLYASDAAVSTIPNEGITGTLKTIRSADGSFSPLQLSSSFVNINGASTLKLNGTTLTATAAELNTLVSSSGTVKSIRVTATSGLIGTQNGAVVSVIDTSATLIVNPSLSVTNFIANTGSFTTKVSGVAAEFSGDVSVNNLFAATNIFIAGTTIASNADVAAVSARVDAVSVLTSINAAAITAINSAITSINAGTFHSLDVSTSVQIGDFINLDGKVLTITGDTDDTFKITAGANGATTLETTDTAGNAANLTLSADGRMDYISNDASGQHRFFGGSMGLAIMPTSGNSGTDASIRNNVADADLLLRGNDGGSYITALKLDMSEAGKATFNSDVITGDINLAGKVITITGDTDDTFSITTGAGGGTVLRTIDDAGEAGYLSLVADGVIEFNSANTYGSILLKKSGTNYGEFYSASDSFSIRNNINDGDINLNGKDGSSYITALKLDMSEAGKAIFNAGAEFKDNVGIGTSAPLKKLHVDGPALSTVQTLTDAATVTSDFDVGQNFTLTLAGNRTLGAPSNVDAGQVGSIFIIQDGTGSRTLAYNSIWKFAGGTAPTLSTDAGAIDRLDYIVQSGTAIQALLTKAYA